MTEKQKTSRAATDVGGTFTDLVYFETNPVNGKQVVRAVKSNTIPKNIEQGVMNVLKKGCVDISQLETMTHGTTVVINALTERKGAKTALLTTRGFRDTLEIGRGNRPDYLNFNYQKPAAFIPRHLRFEITERINHQGQITSKLKIEELDDLVCALKNGSIDSIAICLLNAYANPVHEEILVKEIKQRCADISIVASHQITREWREYERTSTTALAAFVKPMAYQYLTNLERSMANNKFTGQFYVMQSNCGVSSIAASKETPITIVESGPSSGFLGAAELSQLLGEKNVLALDVGGTTAKCSLIKDGKVTITSDYYIERSKLSAGYPILVPVVDLVEIGNGGGSIAKVDLFGKLSVGPESAGANPGPVAYGKGGTDITTTDANLALGRINPDYFCDGEIVADMQSVTTKLTELGQKLKLSAIEIARGVIRIANNNMENALKLISVNRGFDPRDFTMIAFGGGGAVHAAELAMEMGIKKVIIPANAAVFSAWGMMLSDVRRDFMLTKIQTWHDANQSDINLQLKQLLSEAESYFSEESINFENCNLEMFIKLRYQNQEHSLEIPLNVLSVNSKVIAQVTQNFHENYLREYTYQLENEIEMVGYHLVVKADTGKIDWVKSELKNTSLGNAIKGKRDVDFGLHGNLKSTIYDGDKLTAGVSLSGPAIIEQAGTTTVVFPNQKVHLDGYSNIHIALN
ncbi:MAG: hydantoinase/oxoprolinase family protein [Enterobacterales bacterium]|nr:hydantoinase/oxoprolinase family protein [Enterobacterales bacterium]